MKTRIANVLDKAARTLLVAGSFGIAPAVLAQTAPFRAVEKPASVAREADEARLLSPTALPLRVVEMNVQLAWLADPATAPWRLEARTVGSTLEIDGQVPNEGVLRHALQVAQAESGMAVVSKVHLDPMLRAPIRGKSQEVLHQQVFTALRSGFPAQASAITVSTLADGQVILKGTVPTYENKLAISRHLREATTCSAVINQLQVMAESRAPGTQSSARSATAPSFSPAGNKPGSIQPVAHVPSPDLAATGSRTPAGEGLAPPSTDQKEVVNTQPAAEKQPSDTAKSAKPLVYQTKWRRLDPSEVALPKKNVPGPTSKEAMATTDHTLLRVIPSPGKEAARTPGNSAPAKVEIARQPKQPLQPPTTAVQPAVAVADIKSAKSLSGAAPAVLPPPSRMPTARPQPRPVPPGEPYVAEGVIYVESAIKPASHAQSAMAQKPPAIVRTGPYVTTGVILFANAANEDLLNANPALRDLQTSLQQRIAAVCGKSSKDIEVTAVTETNVTIRVRAHSTLEGEELSNRIFQLPELAPCQVALDVLVMK